MVFRSSGKRRRRRWRRRCVFALAHTVAVSAGFIGGALHAKCKHIYFLVVHFAVPLCFARSLECVKCNWYLWVFVRVCVCVFAFFASCELWPSVSADCMRREINFAAHARQWWAAYGSYGTHTRAATRRCSFHWPIGGFGIHVNGITSLYCSKREIRRIRMTN